jgi:hypothetical protein
MGKLNVYPRMPKNLMAKGVWTDMNMSGKYIRHLVYPNISMDTSSGTVYKLKANADQLYNNNTRAVDRAPLLPGADQNGVDYVMNTYRFNYLLDPDKINKAPDRKKKREQEEQLGVIYTTRACRLKLESDAASLLFKTSEWDTEEASAVDWTDENASVLAEIYDLADAFELANGYYPPHMVIGGTPFNYLLKNKQVISKLPNIDYANITADNILQAIKGSSLMNLQKMFVGAATYTISNVKEDTVVRSRLWGSYVWVGDLSEPLGDSTEGATIGVELEGEEDVKTRTWRPEEADEDVEFVEAKTKKAVVNVDTSKGALLTGI